MIATPTMRRGWCVAAALMCVVAARTSRAEVVNRIVATVDGEPITAYELSVYVEDRNMGSLPEQQALDALITDKLLEKEAVAKGIVVKDQELDAYIEQVKAHNKMDDERFTAALAAQGITIEKYRTKVRAELQKTQLVNREIRGRVNVSPEEIERYYEAHQTDYKAGDRVTVRDIMFVIPAGAEAGDVQQLRANAEQVRDKIRGGEDFQKLAAEYSQGPGADNGGMLGSFARGEMDSTLEEVAFSLKPGEVSDPILVGRTIHLIQVDAGGDGDGGGGGGKKRPLDEVRDQIRERLYDQALEQRFADWLSRDLRERHSVEVIN